MKDFEVFPEIILLPNTFSLTRREIIFYFAILAIIQIKYPEYPRDEIYRSIHFSEKILECCDVIEKN